MEYDRAGGEVKRLHGGSSSRTASRPRCLHAQASLARPRSSRGIAASSPCSGARTTARPSTLCGTSWQVLGTIFRFYPAVAATHSPLDALRASARPTNFDARDVVEIRIGLPAWAVSHGAAIHPTTDAISAQFSLAFGIGLQLTTGRNAPEDYFDPARWTDPRVLAIADLVQPHAIEIPAGDPNLSSRAEIVLRDGRPPRDYQPGFHGHPVLGPRPPTISLPSSANNAGGILSPAATDGVVAATLGLAESRERAPPD